MILDYLLLLTTTRSENLWGGIWTTPQFKQRLDDWLLPPRLDRDTGMIFDDIGTVLGHFVPVHNVPPCAHVLGSTVLVFQIIGVLPNIQTKDWELDFVTNPLHERIVLVGSADNLQFVSGAVDHNPNPSRTKDNSGRSFGFEF